MAIYSYDTAAAYLGAKTDRPLPGKATRLQRRDDGGAIAVKYQQTDVVTYLPNGTIVLNSGGWRTSTTKERFKEYTKTYVYSDKGTWYIGRPHALPAGGESHPLYVDGMILNVDGTVVNPQFPTTTDTAAKRELDRQVAKYIKGFAACVTAGELGNPSGGDCWGCCMQDTRDSEQPATESFGRRVRPTMHGRREVMGVGHYLEHFKEQYYVPSLLANAIVGNGYHDPGFIWHRVVVGKDGQFAARILRGYFKRLKPALLAEVGR